MHKIVLKIRHLIRYWAFRRGRAFIYELDRATYFNNVRKYVLPQDYQARFASGDDIPACTHMAEAAESEFHRRFESGDKCFGVFQNSRPANINWIHYGPCYVRGLGYNHPGKISEAYIYGIVTDPSERGKGLYKNALIKLAEELFGAGADNLIQMVEEGNSPVLHTLPQLGYGLKKRIFHFTLLGVKYTSVRNSDETLAERRLFFAPPRNVFII